MSWPYIPIKSIKKKTLRRLTQVPQIPSEEILDEHSPGYQQALEQMVDYTNHRQQLSYYRT